MINALRIPIESEPLKFLSKELRQYDGKRVCAVVPTARNLRFLAGEGFKTIDFFTAKDFTNYANMPSGLRIPKQLRTFYLRKAALSVAKKDRLTLFKNDNGIFMESFDAFAQASVGIFSFYRELASEMVDMENLAKAGKYTDYEEQIKALERLWQNYLELISKDGWTDEWEDFKNPRFRQDFIDRYDEFYFLIGGYLTKYELKQLEQVGGFKNVTLAFNYAGAKYALHEQYEKYLNIKLDNRPLKNFTPSICLPVAASGMAAQLELITKEAFRLEASGISFKKMAVLIPTEQVKIYFLRLDPYNLFDVTSGENIDTYPPYAATRQMVELVSEIKKSKTSSVQIASVLCLFASPCIKETEKAIETCAEMRRLLGKGKLLLSISELEKIPFFKNYTEDALHAPDFLTPSQGTILFKKIFKQFATDYTDNKTQTIIARLDGLEAIYLKITEKLGFEENLKIILNEIYDITFDTPKGKIPVMGILESRNMDFDVIFIPAMNEDIFPPSGKRDLFLNTEIRKELGLPTFLDRENLMKNYLLQVMEKAKFCLISYDGNASARRRSRFVEELIVRNNLNPKSFIPNSLSLLAGVSWFPPKNSELKVEKNEKIIDVLKKSSFSATAFNDYISCPLRFYFKYADKTYPISEPEENISPKHIGISMHKTIEILHKQGVKPASQKYKTEFIKLYRKELSQYDAYTTSPVERFRASQAEDGIDEIAKNEAERENLGFKTIHRELKLESSFMNYKIRGIIDRIDEKDGEVYIVDYKYKTIKPLTSKYVLETQKDLQMPFYAMLYDISQKRPPQELLYFDLKEQFNFVKAFDMVNYEAFKEFAEMKFKEIFSPNIPFIATDNSDNCTYCPYNSVCGRISE